jgi:hypothetical protein
MEFEQYYIEPVYLEREVNYEVSQEGKYLFRLVPGYSGFELSALDRALDAQVDPKLVQRIGEYIVVSEA